jgi:porphobilinogen synthase
MGYPVYRPRRLRRNDELRRMVREASLSADSLVCPLFVVPGKDVKKPIQSMPGNFRMSIDHIIREVRTTKDPGIPAVLLFGIPDEKRAGSDIIISYFAQDIAKVLQGR